MLEPGFMTCPPDRRKAGTIADPPRRLAGRIALLVFGLVVAGCAGTSPVLQQWRLPNAVPGVAASLATPAATATVSAPTAVPAVWQLMSPLQLPDYLDRDALLVPRGQAGLQPLPGHRWAEPLRESVPRLLQQDLGVLRGESAVWRAPLPAGVRVERQLRVELRVFEATADRSAVTLQARWSLADPAGGTAPQVLSTGLSVPVAGRDADALVAAHRVALWQLAERIAAGAGSR